jgi:hypothetical protein
MNRTSAVLTIPGGSPFGAVLTLPGGSPFGIMYIKGAAALAPSPLTFNDSFLPEQVVSAQPPFSSGHILKHFSPPSQSLFLLLGLLDTLRIAAGELASGGS